MKILLYNPDNGVTRNFMPHLWMFLLQTLTPPGHEVFLIDGNARAMTEEELVEFALREGIGLVGIGAMTRMIARAYGVASALRSAGIPVVMGGPHVTEVPDEPLGRTGGPRYADAIALGEADETWPKIVNDAAAGTLKEVYSPVDDSGKERKPCLANYPIIPWEALNLKQFNVVPKIFSSLLRRVGPGWGTFRIIPIESGRGCPYGCEFCTVTGFFGDSIRFRTNESIVEELLRLKARAKREHGQIAVFFVDDNFAINIKRTKSLLRDIIAAGAQLPWTAQISANLLRDEELVDLIAQAGGMLVFIGMESIDPVNLADVNKNFNKPDEYAAVLKRLGDRNLFAITSFIFGMDNDTPGVAERTLSQIRTWPPGLPVFGQLTPFPATPLYDRLLREGRLTRPKHWLDFAPYQMAHTPLKMSIQEAQQELEHAWESSYSAERNHEAIQLLADKSVGWKIYHFIMRISFRGIYFPQMGWREWLSVLNSNRRTIGQLIVEALHDLFGKSKRRQYRLAARDTPNPTQAPDDVACPQEATPLHF
ncbi:MAG: radical SAM protein [Pyrinomonadaceae bacterium]